VDDLGDERRRERAAKADQWRRLGVRAPVVAGRPAARLHGLGLLRLHSDIGVRMRRPRCLDRRRGRVGATEGPRQRLPATLVARRCEAPLPTVRGNPDLATLGVYLAQTDGTGARELVRATLWGSPGVPPAWSPTGRTIVYGETLGVSVHVTRLSTVTADGRHRRTLTSGAAPTWAPDGSRIAFTRTSGIWVIPSRGGRPRRIAAASLRHGLPFPAWSPTGKQLAYNSGNQLYVARVDGRWKRLVARGATGTFGGCCRVSPPVWSRDGLRLYYWS
jgi:hypothetical protein